MTHDRTLKPQADKIDNLDNLLPSSTISYQQMQREIDRISLLKKIVPALTIIVFGALVLWPVLNSKEGSFTLAIDRLESRDENAKLIQPRYVGIDKNNNPVNISAETAFRKSNDDKDYYLKNLLADMKMSDGTAIEVRATNGMFDADEQKIILDGSVSIITESDFYLATNQAIFFINQKISTGQNGMTGATPFGVLRADGFNVDVDQEIIRLKGNVRLHFDPEKPIELPEFNPITNNKQ
ncbi:hypothetical protein MNBD_ALPHA01-792 [hydrothermal vent metagenome]|uniref:Lipopolysaccharide export system protein LptC n=1 Tax=hydrothermal vent metagenome TaxID=652676 RepID=A0A3B0SKE0_9ZZZZ